MYRVVKAFILAAYSVKRITRSRPALIVLMAAPFVAAMTACVLGSSQAAVCATYACLLICAALAWSVVHLQWLADTHSGLAAGIANTVGSCDAR